MITLFFPIIVILIYPELLIVSKSKEVANTSVMIEIVHFCQAN